MNETERGLRDRDGQFTSRFRDTRDSLSLSSSRLAPSAERGERQHTRARTRDGWGKREGEEKGRVSMMTPVGRDRAKDVLTSSKEMSAFPCIMAAALFVVSSSLSDCRAAKMQTFLSFKPRKQKLCVKLTSIIKSARGGEGEEGGPVGEGVSRVSRLSSDGSGRVHN